MFTVVFWKKLWTWLKHYWYLPAILLLLVVAIVSRSKSKEKIFDLLDKQRESYEKEIQIVKEVSEEASKEKTTIAEEYVEEIKKIEEEHSVKIKDLEQEKQKELKSTIKDNKDKPEKLAREIAKILYVTQALIQF